MSMTTVLLDEVDDSKNSFAQIAIVRIEGV